MSIVEDRKPKQGHECIGQLDIPRSQGHTKEGVSQMTNGWTIDIGHIFLRQEEKRHSLLVLRRTDIPKNTPS